MSHTPGPWTWDRAIREGKVLTLSLEALQLSRTVLLHEAHWLPKPADKRLIAAAPDLLAALKDAHEYLESTLAPCDEGCECILHPVEAAIAKAEGRS
jgi:hypothetical protein